MAGNRLGRRVARIGVAALTLALLAGSASAGKRHRYAIRAGKIVTITQGTIDHGIVLVSGGKIEAVGRAHEVEIPSGYEVIDASDRWLMPGMIDIHSHAGVQGGINDMVAQTNPGMRIGDGLDPEAEPVEAALRAGVTTLQTVPGSGTNHGGFGVAFKTAGATKKERLIRRISIMKMTQAYNPERRGGDIGATRMGMAWVLREHLNSAKEYAQARAASEKAKPARGDLSLDPAREVFDGRLPVLIHTYETWGLLMTMGMFHDEFGVSAIATHVAFGGYRAAPEAAERNFAVNIGPRVVDFYSTAEASFRGMIPTFAAHGVTELSVNTDSGWLSQAYLANKAAMAARFGLSDEEALRLVTINAARAILLADRLGSIEVGKDADLVIKETSLLDPTTPVEMVLVNGKIAYRREGS